MAISFWKVAFFVECATDMACLSGVRKSPWAAGYGDMCFESPELLEWPPMWPYFFNDLEPGYPGVLAECP